MIFETHAHYEDEKFDVDRAELLSTLRDNGVGRVINVGSTFRGARMSLTLANKYRDMYAAIGIHPSEISDFEHGEDAFAWLYANAEDEKVVAIGEIGLDYHWEKNRDVQARQRKWFKNQLQLAKDRDLPVIIHSRDAAKDTLDMMSDAAKMNIQGVIHCYSYSPEQAIEYVRLGYYIGVGGVLTFQNGKKLRETVEEIPLERILLETDCPYLAPEPHRGERNESKYLHYVVAKLAEITGRSEEEIEDITWDNATRLFPKVRAAK